MAACPKKRCLPALKRSHFINISGSAFNDIVPNTDCSKGIVLLTDDAGLEDVKDPSLGAFLNTVNRVKTLSPSDVSKHFSPCSSTGFDLASFFGMNKRRGSRPDSIQVAFIDRVGGETLSSAYDEIVKCPVCAWQIVPTLYKTNGDSYVDTTELLDFVKKVKTIDEFDIKVPTFQASLLFSDPFEVTSQASLAAAAGANAEYVICSYWCDVDRDANCNAIVVSGDTVPKERYSNDALLAAGIYGSYSKEDDSYNFTANLKPKRFASTSTASGAFIDETTQEPIAVETSHIVNATAVNSGVGDFVLGATRAVNGFFRTTDGVTYLEALRVDMKQFGDVWFKERAAREGLEFTAISYLSEHDSLGLSEKEANLLAARLAVVLTGLIRKNVINPISYDWEENGYDNIILEADGWVITRKPVSEITDAKIAQRNGYSMGVCFIVNEPQHRININICEFAVVNSELGG